jgi:hypothetical protein
MRILPPNWIRIDLGPPQVQFSTKDLTFAAEPIIHLAPSRGYIVDALLGPRILGVGATAPPGNVHSVPVFERTAPPAGYKREQCLGCFFRFGLARLINQYTFRVCPLVRLTGVSRLYAVLGSDAQELLRRSLRYAGAARIEGLEDGTSGPFGA